jgi:phenylacetate-CoA ligase
MIMAYKRNHVDLENKDYIAWRHFLNEAEGWSKDQIAEYQLREVKRIVAYAYYNTQAYRALYDQAGVHPDSIRTLDDLRHFPFVEKEMIRDHLEDFSVPMEARTYVTTGGSTGIPFGFYREPEAFAKELASKAHQYSRIGWKEDDRQIVFRGLPIDSPDHMTFVPEFNELRCSSYHLTPEWMEAYCQKAREYRPEWIRCYPSSGYVFARFLKDTGRPFPPVKGLLCASENLYDFQKALLKEVFQARVFSHYGHYELAALAGFCEYEDTYHVLPQYGYVELIGSDGQPVTEPGPMGEIVATSFIIHATPFIRYRTRDFATLKGWECPACRRPYQIWDKVDGRLQEFIVTSTGRYISMTAINFHNDIFDHIKQFQFYQGVKGRITFRYIPKASCNERVLEDIRRRLWLKLGGDVELEFQAVDDIPLTQRGKHRFLIQKLPVEFHDA